MRTLSRKFFAIGLLIALLVCSTGRAIPVSALADPIVYDVAPVFDTQLIQLQDYIENGGMTDPQLDIFYILSGIYVMSQAGSQSIRIHDVYEYENDVWSWFKSMGIRAYNTLIGLIPDTAQMPITGEIYSTIPIKNATTAYVAALMGCAMEASSFDNLQQFKDEVSDGQYTMIWNKDIQYGINSIFGFGGGPYTWQFVESPFTSDETWDTVVISGVNYSYYNELLNGMSQPSPRLNSFWGYKNVRVSANGIFDTYHNIFINSTLHTVNVVNDMNQAIPNNVFFNALTVHPTDHNAQLQSNVDRIMSALLRYDVSYDPNSFSSEAAIARAIFNNDIQMSYPNYSRYLFLEDFIKHVYIGSTWETKHEVFNTTDLNFDEPERDYEHDYYVSVPDDTNYLLDIHDLVQDILDNTDLFQIVLNHILTPDGVLVHDNDLIRITTSIRDLLEQTNPILPVNLNDIAEYTDNSYLNRVKEEAKRGGNALAYLVAFWHNCDAELIYVLFGAGITVLVGAFIGKWGHS